MLLYSLEVIFMEKEKLVFPGTHIGPGEMYQEDETKVAEEDEIYSAVIGNLTDKEGKIKPFKERKLLDIDDIVYGIVKIVFESFAVINIYPENKNILSPTDGVIKVMSAKKGGVYLKSMKDAVRVGDIVKAKVSDYRDEPVLSFHGDDLGVVKAFCSVCRFPLVQKGEKLFCEECKKPEMRSVSSNYGNVGLVDL